MVHVAAGDAPAGIARAPKALHAHRATSGSTPAVADSDSRESHDNGTPVRGRSRAGLEGVAGRVMNSRAEDLV